MTDHNPFIGIREFVATVEQGNFTNAARQLGVTASAVGKSVSRLEARLQVKLLHRTTRQVALTQEGNDYFRHCVNVLEELGAAERTLASSAQPAGTLRIELPAAFGRRYIMPALLDFASRYEQVTLSVTFGEKVVDLMNDGIDLAVRIGFLKESADLVARQLGEQRSILCASPAYLARKGAPSSLEDLRNHDCIINWKKETQRNWMLLDSQGQVQTYEVGGRFELGDGQAMLDAVRNGAGVALLPRWLINHHLQAGELMRVLDSTSGPTVPIHALWVRTRYLQPKVRAAIDELVKLSTQHASAFLADPDVIHGVVPDQSGR